PGAQECGKARRNGAPGPPRGRGPAGRLVCSESTCGGSPMRIRHVGVALVATGVLAAGSVGSSAPAPLRSSDETALSPTRLAPGASVEKRIDALLKRMTTKDKLQQVQLLSDGQVTNADAKAGVGGVFSLVDPARINELQPIAVDDSRLGIPILFAYDTIHGFRTIFPVPLGAASSF